MKNFRKLVSILMASSLLLALYTIFNYLDSSYEHVINGGVYQVPLDSIKSEYFYCEKGRKSVEEIEHSNKVFYTIKTPVEKESVLFSQ